MNTAAAALTTTLLLWPLLGPRGRVVVPVVAGTVTLLTAADRVLLGVHHPSDVVAGVLLGTALVGASAIGYRAGDHGLVQKEPHDPARRRDEVPWLRPHVRAPLRARHVRPHVRVGVP